MVSLLAVPVSWRVRALVVLGACVSTLPWTMADSGCQGPATSARICGPPSAIDPVPVVVQDVGPREALDVPAWVLTAPSPAAQPPPR
jgi:hypothetical protein